MGPSGSGKTTLLSLAGGLDRPSEGRVLVAGRDVGSLKPKELAILRRRTVGYVFQDLNLLAGLTALGGSGVKRDGGGQDLPVQRGDRLVGQRVDRRRIATPQPLDPGPARV
jgi:putative ABC transport system ATP-binding protein